MPAEFMPAIPLLLGRGAPTPSGNFPPHEALSPGSQQAFGSSKSLFQPQRGVYSCPWLQQLGEEESHPCVFPGQGQQELGSYVGQRCGRGGLWWVPPPGCGHWGRGAGRGC